MVSITLQPNVRIDPGQLARAITEVPDAIGRELKVAFTRLGSTWHKRMRERQFTGYTSNRSPYRDRLQIRSGGSARQLKVIYPKAGDTLGTLRLVLTTDSTIAPVQEFGHPGYGPKTKRAMTLPTDEVLTGTGQKKPSFKLVRRLGHYETQAGDRTFIYTAKSGSVFVAIQKSKRARLKLLYQLVQRVVIPPGRLGFLRTWEEMAPEIEQEIGNAARRALAGTGGV